MKRSCDADSWSRMRLASVMLVTEVIQPVCTPCESISGETYMRASNSEPSLRLTFTSNPLVGVSPRSTRDRLSRLTSELPAGQ